MKKKTKKDNGYKEHVPYDLNTTYKNPIENEIKEDTNRPHFHFTLQFISF